MAIPSVTDILVFFETQLSKGRASLLGDVSSIANTLVVMEIVFAGMYIALGASADLKATARKILLMGFFFYVIRYYGEILRVVADGFLYAGNRVGAGMSGDINALRNPGSIFSRGLQLSQPIIDKVFADAASSYIGIPGGDGILMMVSVLFSLLCFALMAIQMFVTYIEYLLIASAGFILVPFGIFKPTAFLAERVFGAVIAFGVKLLILALVVGLSEGLLQQVAIPPEVSWQQSMEFCCLSLALAFLSLHAPGIAQGLLSGSPTLSVGTVARTAAGAGSVVSTAVKATGAGAQGAARTVGNLQGGAVAAAAAMGTMSEEKSVAGKAARAASKATMYAVGGAGGVFGAPVAKAAESVSRAFNEGKSEVPEYRRYVGNQQTQGARQSANANSSSGASQDKEQSTNQSRDSNSSANSSSRKAV
jgi:type IV secretion system protein TrbL